MILFKHTFLSRFAGVVLFQHFSFKLKFFFFFFLTTAGACRVSYSSFSHALKKSSVKCGIAIWTTTTRCHKKAQIYTSPLLVDMSLVSTGMVRVRSVSILGMPWLRVLSRSSFVVRFGRGGVKYCYWSMDWTINNPHSSFSN